MGKTIKRIKTFVAMITIIQAILIAVFLILYFLNLFDLASKILPEYVVIGASSIVFINCIFLMIASRRISSLRQKTDLHAAEVIGSDVQEAYNFAMLGLAITDDSYNVIWTNGLFMERHIEIIDTNILEWQTDLNQLTNDAINNDSSVKINVNNCYYEVKFVKDAGLWIFKDITDFELDEATIKNRAPVVGVLSIDNYEEAFSGQDDFNDTATKVKGLIFSYMKEYGVLLRRLKNNQYTMLCTYENFAKMKEDKFSILDKVRELSRNQDIPLTLSIGIAHDFNDFIRLNELAFDCLNSALSRGGDQVVVNRYGSDYEYYGGNTVAQEKRNGVEVRLKADSYLKLMGKASNILVMGHTFMDMDALGACLGIKAMADRVGVPAQLVVDMKATESKTRLALTSSFPKETLSKMVVTPKDAEGKIQPNTLLVVVDVNNPRNVMAPSLLDKVSKIIVIDHHRQGEEHIERTIDSTVDPSASSSCELIAKYIKLSSINPRIELPSSFATIMLSGIFLDSKNYKSKSTGLRTFEASSILKEYGADVTAADDFLKEDFEEYLAISTIIDNMKHPFYGVSTAIAGDGNYEDALISKAADMCLSFKGVHMSFIIGRNQNGVTKISGRSDGTISVQLIMEKLGNGGGHLTAAASYFDRNTPEEAESALLNVLKNYLDDARATTAGQKSVGED